jgi:hypothetical protein
MERKMKIPDEFTLRIKWDHEGKMWSATSPEIPGLMAIENHMSEVIRAVPERIGDLLLAEALER